MSHLTKRVIDAARIPTVAEGDYFLWDDAVKGFGVRLWPSGRKSFVLSYRHAGRKHRITLGDLGALTRDEARKRAAKLRGDVFAGRSPIAERSEQRRQAAAIHAAPTVQEVADAFLDECTAKLKPSTVRGYRDLLGVSTVQRGVNRGTERPGPIRVALGKHKIADVTRADIAKLHLSLKAHPYQANRALAVLSALFTYAELHGFRPAESNPCRRIPKYREARRERYLTAEEFQALGRALAQAAAEGLPVAAKKQRRRASPTTAKHRSKRFGKPVTINPIGLAAIRFLMLSGWREGEALTLEWSHVDFDRRVATLPDSKTGRSVRDLGGAALDVLQEMRRYKHPRNPFVFPGTRPGAHYTDTARVWAAVREAAGLPDVRLHDLRHAFASVAASGGLTLPLIGALLGHKDPSTTARYAHLMNASRKVAADAVSLAVATALTGGQLATQASLPFRE